MISFALQYLAIVQRISVVFLNSVSSECYRISSPLTKTNSGKIKNFFFFLPFNSKERHYLKPSLGQIIS